MIIRENACAKRSYFPKQLPLFDDQGIEYPFLKSQYLTTEEDRLIGAQLAATHHDRLQTSERWIDYLKQLGIQDLSVVNALEIGYDDRFAPRLLPSAKSIEGNVVRGIYQRLGMFNSKGRSAFWGQYTFPLYDSSGQLVGMFGYYRLPSETYPRENIVLFPGHEIGVINLQAFMNEDELIVCRSPKVAAQLWSEGHRNVVAIIGSVMSVKDFVALLKGQFVKQVLIHTESSALDTYWESQLTQALNTLGIEYETFKD